MPTTRLQVQLLVAIVTICLVQLNQGQCERKDFESTNVCVYQGDIYAFPDEMFQELKACVGTTNVTCSSGEVTMDKDSATWTTVANSQCREECYWKLPTSSNPNSHLDFGSPVILDVSKRLVQCAGLAYQRYVCPLDRQRQFHFDVLDYRNLADCLNASENAECSFPASGTRVPKPTEEEKQLIVDSVLKGNCHLDCTLVDTLQCPEDQTEQYNCKGVGTTVSMGVSAVRQLRKCIATEEFPCEVDGSSYSQSSMAIQSILSTQCWSMCIPDRMIQTKDYTQPPQEPTPESQGALPPSPFDVYYDEGDQIQYENKVAPPLGKVSVIDCKQGDIEQYVCELPSSNSDIVNGGYGGQSQNLYYLALYTYFQTYECFEKDKAANGGKENYTPGDQALTQCMKFLQTDHITPTPNEGDLNRIAAAIASDGNCHHQCLETRPITCDDQHEERVNCYYIEDIYQYTKEEFSHMSNCVTNDVNICRFDGHTFKQQDGAFKAVQKGDCWPECQPSNTVNSQTSGQNDTNQLTKPTTDSTFKVQCQDNRKSKYVCRVGDGEVYYLSELDFLSLQNCVVNGGTEEDGDECGIGLGGVGVGVTPWPNTVDDQHRLRVSIKDGACSLGCVSVYRMPCLEDSQAGFLCRYDDVDYRYGEGHFYSLWQCIFERQESDCEYKGKNITSSDPIYKAVQEEQCWAECVYRTDKKKPQDDNLKGATIGLGNSNAVNESSVEALDCAKYEEIRHVCRINDVDLFYIQQEAFQNVIKCLKQDSSEDPCDRYLSNVTPKPDQLTLDAVIASITGNQCWSECIDPLALSAAIGEEVKGGESVCGEDKEWRYKCSSSDELILTAVTYLRVQQCWREHTETDSTTDPVTSCIDIFNEIKPQPSEGVLRETVRLIGDEGCELVCVKLGDIQQIVQEEIKELADEPAIAPEETTGTYQSKDLADPKVEHCNEGMHAMQVCTTPNGDEFTFGLQQFLDIKNCIQREADDCLMRKGLLATPSVDLIATIQLALDTDACEIKCSEFKELPKTPQGEKVQSVDDDCALEGCRLTWFTKMCVQNNTVSPDDLVYEAAQHFNAYLQRNRLAGCMYTKERWAFDLVPGCDDCEGQLPVGLRVMIGVGDDDVTQATQTMQNWLNEFSQGSWYAQTCHKVYPPFPKPEGTCE